MRSNNTCRLCKPAAFVTGALFKYGVRHYCHAECGFRRWGDAFPDMLPLHVASQLPALTWADQPGWTLRSITRYLRKREREYAAQRAARNIGA